MEFLTRTRYARNDELITRIRESLSPDLLKPGYGGSHPMQGHCYVAAEAYYHAMGGSDAGLRPKRMRIGDVVHWWIEEPDGFIVDPTHDQFDNAIDYSQGIGGGFLTAQPSKRAKELMDRVMTKTAYDSEYESEYDEYEEYSMRWIYDESTHKLHVWPIDPEDFEYNTHYEMILELGGSSRWDFSVGYIMRDDSIVNGGGQPFPPETRAVLNQWISNNPNHATYDASNNVEILPVPKKQAKTAGTYLDAFAFIDDNLYVANTHHAGIIQDLVENQGYTFEYLLEKPSAWGWLQHTDFNRNPLSNLRASFTSGTALAGKTRLIDQELKEEAAEALAAHYGKPVKIVAPGQMDMVLWHPGNEEVDPEFEYYKELGKGGSVDLAYWAQKTKKLAYELKPVRITEASGYSAANPKSAIFLKFIVVPQLGQIRYWFADGYYGRPHHYNAMSQALEDAGVDWEEANEWQAGFYAAESDAGYEPGWHMYRKTPVSERTLDKLLQSEYLKMGSTKTAAVQIVEMKEDTHGGGVPILFNEDSEELLVGTSEGNHSSLWAAAGMDYAESRLEWRPARLDNAGYYIEYTPGQHNERIIALLKENDVYNNVFPVEGRSSTFAEHWPDLQWSTTKITKTATTIQSVPASDPEYNHTPFIYEIASDTLFMMDGTGHHYSILEHAWNGIELSEGQLLYGEHIISDDSKKESRIGMWPDEPFDPGIKERMRPYAEKLIPLLMERFPDAVSVVYSGELIKTGSRVRMRERWNEHYNAVPIVVTDKQAYSGAVGDTHGDVYNTYQEIWNSAMRWNGRVFPDGEVIFWYDDPVLTDELKERIKEAVKPYLGELSLYKTEDVVARLKKQAVRMHKKQITFANGHTAPDASLAKYLKFIIVPQLGEIRWWWATGYTGYPWHQDAMTQTSADMQDLQLLDPDDYWTTMETWGAGYYNAKDGIQLYDPMLISESTLLDLFAPQIAVIERNNKRSKVAAPKWWWKDEEDPAETGEQIYHLDPNAIDDDDWEAQWAEYIKNNPDPDDELDGMQLEDDDFDEDEFTGDGVDALNKWLERKEKGQDVDPLSEAHKPEKWKTKMFKPRDPTFIQPEQYQKGQEIRWAYHPDVGLSVWWANSGFHLDWERINGIKDGTYAGGVVDGGGIKTKDNYLDRPVINEYHADDDDLTWDGISALLRWMNADVDDYYVSLWPKYEWKPQTPGITVEEPEVYNPHEDEWEKSKKEWNKKKKSANELELEEIIVPNNAWGKDAYTRFIVVGDKLFYSQQYIEHWDLIKEVSKRSDNLTTDLVKPIAVGWINPQKKVEFYIDESLEANRDVITRTLIDSDLAIEHLEYEDPWSDGNFGGQFDTTNWFESKISDTEEAAKLVVIPGGIPNRPSPFIYVLSTNTLYYAPGVGVHRKILDHVYNQRKDEWSDVEATYQWGSEDNGAVGWFEGEDIYFYTGKHYQSIIEDTLGLTRTALFPKKRYRWVYHRPTGTIKTSPMKSTFSPPYHVDLMRNLLREHGLSTTIEYEEWDAGYLSGDRITNQEGVDVEDEELRAALNVTRVTFKVNDPKSMEITNEPVRGSSMYPFGFVDGELYFGEGHHAAIVYWLIENGYDWEKLEAAPQLWGWARTDIERKEIGASLMTDVARIDSALINDFKKKIKSIGWNLDHVVDHSPYDPIPEYGERARERYEPKTAKLMRWVYDPAQDRYDFSNLSDEAVRVAQDAVSRQSKTAEIEIGTLNPDHYVVAVGELNGKRYVEEEHYYVIEKMLDAGATEDQIMNQARFGVYYVEDGNIDWYAKDDRANDWEYHLTDLMFGRESKTAAWLQKWLWNREQDSITTLQTYEHHWAVDPDADAIGWWHDDGSVEYYLAEDVTPEEEATLRSLLISTFETTDITKVADRSDRSNSRANPLPPPSRRVRSDLNTHSSYPLNVRWIELKDGTVYTDEGNPVMTHQELVDRYNIDWEDVEDLGMGIYSTKSYLTTFYIPNAPKKAYPYQGGLWEGTPRETGKAIFPTEGNFYLSDTSQDGSPNPNQSHTRTVEQVGEVRDVEPDKRWYSGIYDPASETLYLGQKWMHHHDVQMAMGEEDASGMIYVSMFSPDDDDPYLPTDQNFVQDMIIYTMKRPDQELIDWLDAQNPWKIESHYKESAGLKLVEAPIEGEHGGGLPFVWVGNTVYVGTDEGFHYSLPVDWSTDGSTVAGRVLPNLLLLFMGDPEIAFISHYDEEKAKIIEDFFNSTPLQWPEEITSFDESGLADEWRDENYYTVVKINSPDSSRTESSKRVSENEPLVDGTVPVMFDAQNEGGGDFFFRNETAVAYVDGTLWVSAGHHPDIVRAILNIKGRQQNWNSLMEEVSKGEIVFGWINDGDGSVNWTSGNVSSFGYGVEQTTKEKAYAAVQENWPTIKAKIQDWKGVDKTAAYLPKGLENPRVKIASDIEWEEWHESNDADSEGWWKAMIDPKTNRGVWWFAENGEYPFHSNVYTDWGGGDEWETTHSYSDDMIFAQGTKDKVRWARPEGNENLFQAIVENARKESHVKKAAKMKIVEVPITESHGGGKPFFYHNETDTLYIGSHEGFHSEMYGSLPTDMNDSDYLFDWGGDAGLTAGYYAGRGASEYGGVSFFNDPAPELAQRILDALDEVDPDPFGKIAATIRVRDTQNRFDPEILNQNVSLPVIFDHGRNEVYVDSQVYGHYNIYNMLKRLNRKDVYSMTESHGYYRTYDETFYWYDWGTVPDELLNNQIRTAIKAAFREEPPKPVTVHVVHAYENAYRPGEAPYIFNGESGNIYITRKNSMHEYLLAGVQDALGTDAWMDVQDGYGGKGIGEDGSVGYFNISKGEVSYAYSGKKNMTPEIQQQIKAALDAFPEYPKEASIQQLEWDDAPDDMVNARSFGYVNGELHEASSHHMVIMEKLIGEMGFEGLESAKQIWGWMYVSEEEWTGQLSLEKVDHFYVHFYTDQGRHDQDIAFEALNAIQIAYPSQDITVLLTSDPFYQPREYAPSLNPRTIDSYAFGDKFWVYGDRFEYIAIEGYMEGRAKVVLQNLEDETNKLTMPVERFNELLKAEVIVQWKE